MPTVEEAGADKCPRCKRTMDVVNTVHRKIDNIDGIHTTYHCNTENCPWEGTGRVVSTDTRGNILAREAGERGQDKDFPIMTNDQLSSGKRQVEQYLRRRIDDDTNIPTARENDELPESAE